MSERSEKTLTKFGVAEEIMLDIRIWQSFATEFPLVNDIRHRGRCKLIHPLQQRAVDDLIDYIEHDSQLKCSLDYVIIFGSSITFDCNSWSDLDVACKFIDDTDLTIKVDRMRQAIRATAYSDYDLIWLNRDDLMESLIDEIKYKGVTIWKQNGLS